MHPHLINIQRWVKTHALDFNLKNEKWGVRGERPFKFNKDKIAQPYIYAWALISIAYKFTPPPHGTFGVIGLESRLWSHWFQTYTLFSSTKILFLVWFFHKSETNFDMCHVFFNLLVLINNQTYPSSTCRSNSYMGYRWTCLCVGHAIPKQEGNENQIQ